MSDTPITDGLRITELRKHARNQEKALVALAADLALCIKERNYYKGLVTQVKAVLDTYAGRGSVADK